MKLKFVILLFGIMFLYGLPLFAQDDPTLPSPAEGAPLDGGLSLLVAAGVGYTYRRLRKNNRD